MLGMTPTNRCRFTKLPVGPDPASSTVALHRPADRNREGKARALRRRRRRNDTISWSMYLMVAGSKQKTDPTFNQTRLRASSEGFIGYFILVPVVLDGRQEFPA